MYTLIIIVIETTVSSSNDFVDYIVNINKSAQSNLGRGPRRCESLARGGLITTAKVVGRRRVYYAAPASTDTVGQGFR